VTSHSGAPRGVHVKDPDTWSNWSVRVRAGRKVHGSYYTYFRTWNGFVYLAFILDCYSRMIVGWQLATHLCTDLVLDALEMANGLRQPDAGLIAHTDRGSQYTSLAYTDRRDELGAAPSVGSRGDAYDNAMAETWVATFKTELVDARRFPSYEHAEHETLHWIGSTTASGCTKNSMTCRRPSTRS
jgi:transposase InsO family protein